jgi:hypothetical protein
LSRKHLDKDAVAILAILGAVIWGTWLFARQGLELDAEWTDGQARYAAADGERIRHAIWDDAELLGGGVNGEGTEARPALSPDGRYLVFATGERGLNADLWVADLVGSEVRDPRPLPAANSAFDDLAPAFGDDALYFASDRGGSAYGLDLWRMPYANGSFGAPESLGSGINGLHDDTDPFPVPGSADVLFASDRPRFGRRDHDLFRAQHFEREDGTTGFEVQALDALNTPFEERDPTLTPDGKTLYFASNRVGTRGGFDLWRSFDEGDGWMPPGALVGINTTADERGPLPSRDGFALLFDSGAQADLWRATSRELFRVPQPPLGWRQLLGIAALLALAILAWMAKRWRGIDVLYRCLMVSVVVHLALLWFLRDVTPDSPSVLTAGEERLFHVRLAAAPTGTNQALVERAGQVEATRATATEAAPDRRERTNAAALNAPLATSQAVQAAVPDAAAAPARDAAALTASAASAAPPTADVRVPTESTTRVERHAPTVELTAPAASAPSERNATAQAAQPGRNQELNTTSNAALLNGLQPNPARGAAQTAQRAAQDERLAQGPSRATLDASASVTTTSAKVAVPRASSGSGPALGLTAAPTLELTRPDSAQASVREISAGPARAKPATDAPSSTADSTVDSSSGATLLATRPNGSSAPGPERQSAWAERSPTGTELDVQVALGRSESAAEVTRAGAAPAALDLGQAIALGTLERSTPTGGPTRKTSSAQGHESNGPGAPRTPSGASANALAAAARQPDSAPDTPGFQPSKALLDGSEPLVELRAPGESGFPSASGTASSADKAPTNAPTFDATAGLAARASERAAPKAKGPERKPLTGDHVNDRPALEAPLPAPLAFEASAAPDFQPQTERPSAFAQTPYKNRFGEEKLRALEEFGGSLETEAAVQAGLEYLARKQRPGGSWGRAQDVDLKYGDVRIGKSGLALLAFLGAGHTPTSATDYSPVAQAAVTYLLDSQNPDNGHFGGGSSYGHGIATYALAECYALTKAPELVEPLQRAIAQILRNQVESRDEQKHGGWGYYFADGHVWNRDRWPRASITSWQLMALESARLGGLDVPDEAFQNAGLFLANSWDARLGAFRYSHDPARLNSGYPTLPASTPAAMFGLSLLGIDLAGPVMDGARAFVLTRLPDGYERGSERDFVRTGQGNLYFWYYSTLAMFRAGGTSWQRWNVAMKETLLGGQADDGSWRPISSYAEYAGDTNNDRSYTTAINVLTLEVYYRYFTPLLAVK